MLRTLITLGCLVIIIGGIRAAAVLVVPFLLALFLAILLTPVYFRLKRFHLPTSLALTIVIIGLGVFLFLSMTILRSSLDEFTVRIPFYEAGMRRELQGLLDWLTLMGVDTTMIVISDWFSPQSVIGYAGRIARSLSLLLGQGFFVFIITAFMLVEASGFHTKFLSLEGGSEGRAKLIEDSLEAIRNYVSIKSVMSLLTGAAVAFWLYMMDVDHYLFMGLLAFFLNFVPNIGSFIAGIPGVLLAFVIHGPVTATFVAIGYVAINVAVSNIIEPRFIGDRLGISPLIVLVSLVFWGWVLGPAGMLLSVPLTMFAKIVLENNNRTRSWGLLLGPAPIERGRAADTGEDR